jgi:hypothetical protein
VAEHLAELLLDQLGAVAEHLAQLNTRLFDLLLHKQERRVVALFAEERIEPSQKEPTEKC